MGSMSGHWEQHKFQRSHCVSHEVGVPVDTSKISCRIGYNSIPNTSTYTITTSYFVVSVLSTSTSTG